MKCNEHNTTYTSRTPRSTFQNSITHYNLHITNYIWQGSLDGKKDKRKVVFSESKIYTLSGLLVFPVLFRWQAFLMFLSLFLVFCGVSFTYLICMGGFFLVLVLIFDVYFLTNFQSAEERNEGEGEEKEKDEGKEEGKEGEGNRLYSYNIVQYIHTFSDFYLYFPINQRREKGKTLEVGHR